MESFVIVLQDQDFALMRNVPDLEKKPRNVLKGAVRLAQSRIHEVLEWLKARDLFSQVEYLGDMNALGICVMRGTKEAIQALSDHSAELGIKIAAEGRQQW